jgi:hypothetical protein
MKTAKEYAAMLRGAVYSIEVYAEDAKAIAGLLELIEEHVADMERKGVELRKDLRRMYGDAHLVMDRVRLAAKASTYDEEARRLKAILEGK